MKMRLNAFRIGKKKKIKLYACIYKAPEKGNEGILHEARVAPRVSPRWMENEKAKQPPAQLTLDANTSQRGERGREAPKHKHGVSAFPSHPPKWGYGGNRTPSDPIGSYNRLQRIAALIFSLFLLNVFTLSLFFPHVFSSPPPPQHLFSFSSPSPPFFLSFPSPFFLVPAPRSPQPFLFSFLRGCRAESR